MINLESFISSYKIEDLENYNVELQKSLAVQQKVFKDCEEKVKNNINTLEEVTNELDKLNKIKEVLNKASEISRDKAVAVIENTVNPMLQGIVGDNYTFKVIPGALRGKPSVEFKIITDVDGNISEQNPETSCGGGLIDIISTALRYSFLSLYDGGINNAAILDEPGRMISTHGSQQYADFIKYLGTAFNRQTIMCTHNPSIAKYADKIIEVSKPHDTAIISYPDTITI